MRQTRRRVYGWRKFEGERVPHRVVIGHRCYINGQEMEMCLHNMPPTFVYRARWEAAIVRLSDWLGLGIDPPMRILHGVPVQVVAAGEVICTINSGVDWIDFPRSIRHIVSGADVQRAAHGYKVTLHRHRLTYTVRRKLFIVPTTPTEGNHR